MVDGIVGQSGHSQRHELSRLMAEYTRRILRTEYWGNRESFALQMINANRDVAEKYFRGLLNHRSPLARELAVHILGIKYNLDVDIILNVLRSDPDESVRCNAANVFKYRKEPKAVAALIAAIQDNPSEKVIRPICTDALGNIGGKEATEFLRKLLFYDTSPIVVALAGQSLIEINTPDSIAVLFEALKVLPDENGCNFNVGVAARCLARGLNNRFNTIGNNQTALLTAISLAKNLLTDSREWVIETAILCLGNILPNSELGFLVNLYQESDLPHYRGPIIEALSKRAPALATQLKNGPNQGAIN